MQLLGLFTGALTWRRLLVLLTGLPATSRLARAVHGPTAQWSTLEYLVAQAADGAALVADELAAFRWTWVTANTRKGGKRPKRPEPYPRLPRPGQDQIKAPTPLPTSRKVSKGQAAAALMAHARRQQAAT